MFLIGLTGGIASGKSTVSKMFAAHGFPVVDADILSRKVVEPGRKAWHKLKKEFGEEIFLEDGTLNRERLAEIIFADRAKRRRLNEITHPAIVWEMVKQVISLAFRGHPRAIMDIPLLYEAGDLVHFMHKVIVVRCEGPQQVERLLTRTKMTQAQAEQRVAAQMPLDEKAEKADYVIDNSGDVDSTKRQVDLLAADLLGKRFHYKIRAYILLAITIFVVASFFSIQLFYRLMYK